MNPVIVLATVGAGFGLAAGLAFNLRIARALGVPVAATLVNFLTGMGTVLLFWLLGVGRHALSGDPAPWMLLGGLFGATYVTLALVTAARLGAGVSTVAVTLGQVLGALVIGAGGWLGQEARLPSPGALLSAALLLAAVAVLARDRESRP